MADEVYRGSQSLLEVQGEETQETREQELVATLQVESNEQEEQQEQELVALLTVEDMRLPEEEEQHLVALLDVEEPRRDVDEEPEIIAILDVLEEVPPIPVAPPQGFQAELGLIYLYNPDAANALIHELNVTIHEVNEAVEDITQLTVDALKIKPYSLIGEPIAQYTPCTFDGCIYVALNTMEVKSPTFDPTQWAKIATADYTKLYNKPNFITRADLSCTVPGLTYNAETGVLSQTNGYVIPTTGRMSTIETGIATNAANLTVETRERTSADTALGLRIDSVQGGLNAEIIDRTQADAVINGTVSSLSGSLNSHINNTNNPHNVTKAQLGLGNVNNTADLDKPISTLTQQALDALSGRIVSIVADLADYRTAAAQDLIDSQIRTEISNVDHNVTLEAMARVQADAALGERIEDIEEVIPSAASTSNLLADRDFVNSSINNMAAHYITASASGNAFGDHARLIQGPWYFQGAEVNPTINDYALVIADETHSGETARYVYDGAQWAFQWTINNTQFTQDQINAINSHITYELVQEYSAHVADFNNPHNVTKYQVGLGNVDNTSDLQKPISTATQAALNAKQNTISDLDVIRSGAALGATSVQPSTLNAYETVAHAAATYQVIGDYVLTSTMNAALAGKQDTLIAGTNITIQDNVISAASTTSLPWGAITGDINNQQDLKNALNGKQNELIAGENITIVDNVISATGGGGGIENIDGETITMNADDEIQANAVIDHNSGILKHWTGTLAEYNAMQDHASDTVYIITDDASPANVYTKSEVNTLLSAKANSSDVYSKEAADALLDKKVSTNTITNCITEIPQDIKLELSSGTLTLKAGSKVCVPNGVGVFDTVTVSSDVIITPTGGTGQCMISVNATATAGNATGISGCVSGANPTIPDYGLGYNTTTNIIQRTGGSGSVVIAKSSFPLAIVTQTNGVITSINQVFNGFGYIGAAWFMLPGVKGLAPNGFNPDGTHKNISFTNPSVYVYTAAPNTARSIGVQINTSGTITDVINTKLSNITYGLTKNKPTTMEDSLGHWYYATDENQWYYTTGSTTASWYKAYPVFGGQRTGDSTTTTSIVIKQTFSPLDINEFQVLLGIMYPIGAIYIGTQTTCPMAQLMPGTTWELVSSGKALWTGTGSNANTTIAAGLPNITGDLVFESLGDRATGIGGTGAFTLNITTQGNDSWDHNGNYGRKHSVNFNATRSSSIYGNSTTVQPPAYVVNVWRRTV